MAWEVQDGFFGFSKKTVMIAGVCLGIMFFGSCLVCVNSASDEETRRSNEEWYLDRECSKFRSKVNEAKRYGANNLEVMAILRESGYSTLEIRQWQRRC